MADAIVAGWLADLDLGSCIATFRDEGIDSEALSCLTDEQLVQLGVRRMGDRSKLRAKALGSMPGAAPLKQQVATPAPAPGKDPRGAAAAAPQAQQQLPLQRRSTHAGNRGAGQAPDYVPEHLQVLKRLSLSPKDSHKASGGARRSHATEAGTDADKALALSFILAGGPLEKYRQGGKSKAHKKFIKILPDRKMAYDAKAVGPITGVKEGGAEFHTTDEEVIARSFTIVLEGDVDVHIIAPSLKDKRSWVAGIGHLVTGTTPVSSSSSADAHVRPSSSKHSSASDSRRSAGGSSSTTTSTATSTATKAATATAMSTAPAPPSNDSGMRLPIPSASAMDAPPSTAPSAFTGARSQQHHAHTGPSSSSSTASIPHPALTSNNVNNNVSNSLSSTAPSQNAARSSTHSQVDAPASARQSSSSAPGGGLAAVSTPLSSSVNAANQVDVVPPPRSATVAAAAGSRERPTSSSSSSILLHPASTASSTNAGNAPPSSSSSSTLPSDRFVMLDDGLAPLSRPAPNASSSSSSSRPAPDAPSPLPVPATPPPRAAQPRNPAPPTSVSQADLPTTAVHDDEGEAKPEQWRVSDAGLKTCGGSVLKSKDPEEFAVALMSHSIEPGSGIHEWEVEWSGQMHWCGVGVASGSVRTRGSLRRPDVRDMAWFWHSKGFLCNGDEFVEWDGVPGYAERERITVTYDSNQGMLRFASGAKQTSVPGAISGIKGTVLPMVYTDGQHITCSLIVAPHKK